MIADERTFNLNGDVDQLYLPRKEGRKRLMNVEDIIKDEEENLAQYIRKNGNYLTGAAK